MFTIILAHESQAFKTILKDGFFEVEKAVITSTKPLYRPIWSGKLLFYNDDNGTSIVKGVRFFKDVEKSYLRLKDIHITIKKDGCFDYEGIIRKWKFLDKCSVEVEIIPNDFAQCVFDRWEKPISLESLPSKIVAISPSDAIIETETVERILSTEYKQFPKGEITLIGNSDEWCIKETIITDISSEETEDGDLTQSFWRIKTTWWREVSQNELTGWKQLADGRYWRCPVMIGGDLTVKDLTDGKLFSEAIEKAVLETLFDCDVTGVKSAFWGIGEGFEVIDNLAYQYALNTLRTLTIHEKSNVKRPLAPMSAFGEAWNITLKQILDLCELMQVYWTIEDGIFIIEHESYFENQTEKDLRNEIQGYDREIDNDLKRYSKYEWLDSGFDAVVDYGTFFEGEESFKSDTFATNVQFIARHTLNDEGQYDANDQVSEDGFVLIAANFTEGNIFIINEENGLVNYAMSWETIVKNCIRGNAKEATINDSPFEFSYLKRILKGSTIIVKSCCNYQDYKHGALTLLTDFEHIKNAYIEETRYDIGKNEIEIDVKYEFD